MTTEFPYAQRFAELKQEHGLIAARRMCDRENLKWQIDHAESITDLQAVLRAVLEQLPLR